MDLIDKVFTQQDFSRQDLSDRHFRRCHFYQCDFRHANLRDASFEACHFIEPGAIEGCHFNFADLRDASFKACRLSLANFAGANCFGIEFRECDLKGANFSRSRFYNQISHTVYFCSALHHGLQPRLRQLERPMPGKVRSI